MIERLGNTPSIGGQSEYLVESGPGVGLYKGNPVSLQDAAGAEGFLQDASFATTDDTGTGGAAYDNGADSVKISRCLSTEFFTLIAQLAETKICKFSWTRELIFGTDYNTGKQQREQHS